MTEGTTLLSCPFCGGEAETLTAERTDGYIFWVMCHDCCSCGDGYDTEAEAIAAWNSRAELGSERDAELQKALNKAAGNWARVDAELRNALDFMRIWISEDAHLGESAISREFEKAEGLRKLDTIEDAITGKLNSRAERTCIDVNDDEHDFTCSECGASMYTQIDECWTMIGKGLSTSDVIKRPNHCPNCGAKVVGE